MHRSKGWRRCGGMGDGRVVGVGGGGGEKEQEEGREGKSRKETNADGLLLFKGSKLLDDDYNADDKVEFMICSYIVLFGD